jgi:hypothetical protein
MESRVYLRFPFPKLFTCRTPGSFENRRVIVSGDIPQRVASSLTLKCLPNVVVAAGEMAEAMLPHWNLWHGPPAWCNHCVPSNISGWRWFDGVLSRSIRPCEHCSQHAGVTRHGSVNAGLPHQLHDSIQAKCLSSQHLQRALGTTQRCVYSAVTAVGVWPLAV